MSAQTAEKLIRDRIPKVEQPLTEGGSGKASGRGVTIDEATKGLKKVYQEARSVLGMDEPMWKAPYNELTYDCRLRFIYDKVWTWHDQNRQAERIQWKKYIDWYVWHWHDCAMKGEPLAIEKARRILITWITRALELHDLGIKRGGLLVAGQTYTDAGGFVNRARVIYDEVRKRNPDWKLAEALTYGSEDKGKLDTLVLPNGSIITAINQDPESFRGDGVTMAALEEGSSYSRLAKAWGQAITVCQGSPGRPSGHKIIIANANANAEWSQIKQRRGEETTPSRPEYGRNDIFEGCPPQPEGTVQYRSNTGNRILQMHYSCDLDKATTEWVTTNSAGIPKREWEQEYELDCSVHDGDPMHEDFHESIHCPGPLKSMSWEAIKATYPGMLGPGSRANSQYVLGIDCGQTLWPAAVLLEIGPWPFRQIVAVLEIKAEGNEPMGKFCPRVMDVLRKRFPSFWPDIEWVGDPAVNVRDGSYGKSANDVAREFGCSIKSMTGNLHYRLSAVDWALLTWVTEDCPKFYVCAKDCPTLFAALKGGYRSRPPVGGPSTGRDQRLPVKDVHSHIADALQYAMIRAKQLANPQQ